MFRNFDDEKNIINSNSFEAKEQLSNLSVSTDNNTIGDDSKSETFFDEIGLARPKIKHINKLSLGIWSIGILLIVTVFLLFAYNFLFSKGDGLEKQTGKYGESYDLGSELSNQYDYVGSFSNGLAKVKKGGLCGYVNLEGHEVIACQYDDGFSFCNNFAWVKKDNKWGVIDNNGNMVLPFEYYHSEYFKYDSLIKVEKYEIDGKKVGVMDQSGREIVPIQYDKVYLISSTGLFGVLKGEKRGLFNKSGQMILPVEYDYFDIESGLISAEKDGKCGCLNIYGEEIVPLIYDSRICANELYKVGFERVYKNGKYGYVNADGKEVVPCKYSLAEKYIYPNGLAKVARTDGNGYAKYGYVNMNGEECIPCIYDECRLDTNEGIVIVSSSGKDSCISIETKSAVSAQYSEIENFSDGMARVINEGYDYLHKKFGYIDKSGKEIIPCQYDYAELDPTKGLIKVKKDGKYGYCDINGKLVVDFIYE